MPYQQLSFRVPGAARAPAVKSPDAVVRVRPEHLQYRFTLHLSLPCASQTFTVISKRRYPGLLKTSAAALILPMLVLIRIFLPSAHKGRTERHRSSAIHSG